MVSNNFIKKRLGIACLAGGLVCTQAFAIDFTVANWGSTPGGPYGSVTITLGAGGTTANVLFTAAATAPAGSGYYFVDSDIADLNLASAATVSLLTFKSGATTVTPGSTSVGSGSVDGFGTFSLTISAPGVNNVNQIDFISFTLTKNSGTWADAAAVLTGNDQGRTVAAHLYDSAINYNGGNTGFVSDGGTPSVPDGGTTLALLGSALAGLGLIRRK